MKHDWTVPALFPVNNAGEYYQDLVPCFVLLSMPLIILLSTSLLAVESVIIILSQSWELGGRGLNITVLLDPGEVIVHQTS